jgi:hypothetical protein
MLLNKYTSLYHKIINKAKIRDVTPNGERHHIVPRFMNGLDIKANLVLLTAKEHLLCHKLLIRCVEDQYRYAAIKSVYMMLNYSHFNGDVRLLFKAGLARKYAAEWMKRTPMPEITKQKCKEATLKQFSDPAKREKHLIGIHQRWGRQDEIDKIKIANAKRYTDPNEKAKISNSLKQYYAENGHPLKGRPGKSRSQTQEEKDKRSATMKKHFQDKKDSSRVASDIVEMPRAAAIRT